MAASALLTVQDLHTFIGGSHVLQGVSFAVPAGKTTMLLGRNGAGKSTTLRSIMGVLPAQSGSITLEGQELRGRPSHLIARRGVAFVPEDREVFVALTVEENLKLAQRRNGDVAAIDHVYQLFPDLYRARHRSAGAMSGGQQQMLAIGRALVQTNRIMLVDEPTKGLAPIIVQELQATFSSLRARGETILLVEQNLEFAQAVGDLYFILDEGQIVQGGSMAELSGQSAILQRYLGV